jgi:uncharacterized protein YkwD
VVVTGIGCGSATVGSGPSAGGRDGSPGTGGTPSSGGTSGTSGATGAGGASGAGGCAPDYACTPTAPNTGDYAADCVARVNQFRACVCLPPLTRWTAGESCANQDAAYDPANGAHAGFIADLCSPEGFAQDECPAWPSETQVVSGCLQQMFDEGPPPTANCTGDCYETHGHFINMTNTSYTMVACGIATVNGQITAVQDFQ